MGLNPFNSTQKYAEFLYIGCHESVCPEDNGKLCGSNQLKKCKLTGSADTNNHSPRVNFIFSKITIQNCIRYQKSVCITMFSFTNDILNIITYWMVTLCCT